MIRGPIARSALAERRMMAPMTPSAPLDRRALAIGIVGPLGIVALAFALWRVSDRLLYVGPLDRAAFGWLVVMPVWWLSPAAAALLWRDLPSRWATIAAAAIGAMLAAFTFVLAWTTIAREMGGCQFGPRTPAGALVVPIALVGLALGTGWAVSALTASSMVRGGRVASGLGAGIGVLIAVTFTLIVVVSLLIVMFLGCNRPN
jgi:hypothetical protein